jgi:hypothetical protein
MTYVKRSTIRKSKDILALALKNLWPGDELLCTSNTYSNIKDRIEEFSTSHKDRRIDAIPWGTIRKIRRTL